MNKKIKNDLGQVQVTDREKPSKVGKLFFVVTSVISYISVISFLGYNIDLMSGESDSVLPLIGIIVSLTYGLINTVFIIVQYNNAKSKDVKRRRKYFTKGFKYVTVALKCLMILIVVITMITQAHNLSEVGDALWQGLAMFSVLTTVFLDISLFIIKRKFKKAKQ